MSTFITNSPSQKSLKERLHWLLKESEELKFLVGFFYFSGWQEFYQELKNKPDIKLKILVGLQVEKLLKDTVEFSTFEELSQDEIKNNFFKSLINGLNNRQFDNQEFYEQIDFFLELLQQGRLIIRKTREPNHSKLYLFKFSEYQRNVMGKAGSMIIGSSNLTHAGLAGQNELNVEITDYGYDEAQEYFDRLWETSVDITTDANDRQLLIDIVKTKTQVAEVTPIEAYAFILKTYLEVLRSRDLGSSIDWLLEENGFKKFKYQTDAVSQALNIIEQSGGVIIADVVGLGKSVIASLIATQLGKRGIVLCPPSLIGDKTAMTGWYGYLSRFHLYNWEVESFGKLQELTERDAEHSQNYQVVIVDEAHRFRNEDTSTYEALANFVRGKIVILLTATPFNNTPADIFSLLKLFIVPGKSSITIADDLERTFNSYNYKFKNLSFILKNYQSTDDKKREKAEKYYLNYFGQLPVKPQLVRAEVSKMAGHIKSIISPVVIRRNRLDLLKDAEYSKEITELSQVEDPKELFYELTPEQSEFYDKIIDYYFGNNGIFTGAIYRPFLYERRWTAEQLANLEEEENRIYQSQSNLYDFMRRILVKRFESSFGAFAKSIERFLKTHKMVLEFVGTSGIYFLDRDIIEKVYTEDDQSEGFTEEAIAIALEKFKKKVKQSAKPKNTKIYNIEEFEQKDEFFAAIENDIKLFEQIQDEIQKLKLIDTDPKRKKVIEEIQNILSDKNQKPKRKVVLFSEYVDTIKYLREYFTSAFGKRVLICEGKVSQDLARKIEENFNAQLDKKRQKDNYDILITSDKLSEGVNLNRAGLIINYDIPWNPTRVIQRVGRINRIGVKVFDKLYIYNFFPTEQGADIVKSREIASQKMFLIHNALGEDAKIFDPEEEPTPSALFQKINANPDKEGEINFITLVRNEYREINDKYPEVIERISRFPMRIKTAKPANENSLVLLKRKGLAVFSLYRDYAKPKPEEMEFAELLEKVKCEYNTEKLNLSPLFWIFYEELKEFKPKELPATRNPKNEKSIDVKALNSLKSLLKQKTIRLTPSQRMFVQALITDIKNYKTLPTYTLRRLVLEENKYKKLVENIDELKQTLGGENYLKQIREKVNKIEEEVIVAVENRVK